MTPRMKSFTLLSGLAAALFLVSGCAPSAPEGPAAPGTTVAPGGAAALALLADPAWDRSVGFGWPDGPYTATSFTSDFGNVNGYSTREQGLCTVENGALKVTLPANAWDGSSGLVANNVITTGSEYYLEYRVKFDSDFDYAKGGKIPGLSGGDHITGGNDATLGRGWSVRIMWRENGRLIPYVYHKDQTTEFGDTFGATLHPGLAKGTWYTLRYYLKMNTSTKKNGVLRIWIDGTEVFSKTDLRYATVAGKNVIDWMHWSVFRGGSTEDWASPTAGSIGFDDVRLDCVQ